MCVVELPFMFSFMLDVTGFATVNLFPVDYFFVLAILVYEFVCLGLASLSFFLGYFLFVIFFFIYIVRPLFVSLRCVRFGPLVLPFSFPAVRHIPFKSLGRVPFDIPRLFLNRVLLFGEPFFFLSVAMGDP